MSSIMSGTPLCWRFVPVARMVMKRSRHIHKTTFSRLWAPLSVNDLTTLPVDFVILTGMNMVT